MSNTTPWGGFAQDTTPAPVFPPQPEADEDTYLDDDITDEVENVEEDTDTDAEPEAGTTKRGGARSGGVDKALVRRVVTKTLAVSAADQEVRDLAAQVIGASPEVEALAVAIMTADRSSAQALADFRSLSEVEVVEVAVTFMGMPKPRAKAVWALLVSLGVAAKAMPGSDAKAAMAAASAFSKVGAEQTALIETVGDLLKK